MSRVARTVFLSSLGADQATGTGMIQSLHEQEARFRSLASDNLLMLRAGALFDNVISQIGLMRSHGFHAEAIEEDLAIPMVSAADIAQRVVIGLTSEVWRGHRMCEVLGHSDISMRTVTRVLQEKLDMPRLRYLKLSYDDYAAMLAENGFAPDVAALTAELSRGINEGRIRSVHGRHPESTTATSFAEHLEGALAPI
jgi:uncharacterized protein YbjT (DUF2867 family)